MRGERKREDGARRRKRILVAKRRVRLTKKGKTRSETEKKESRHITSNDFFFSVFFGDFFSLSLRLPHRPRTFVVHTTSSFFSRRVEADNAT